MTTEERAEVWRKELLPLLGAVRDKMNEIRGHDAFRVAFNINYDDKGVAQVSGLVLTKDF